MCQYCEIGISKWSYEILRNVGCRKKLFQKWVESNVLFNNHFVIRVSKIRGIFMSFFFGCG
jgi:hypothetical protein